jgi:hypothetical protein
MCARSNPQFQLGVYEAAIFVVGQPSPALSSSHRGTALLTIIYAMYNTSCIYILYLSARRVSRCRGKSGSGWITYLPDTPSCSVVLQRRYTFAVIRFSFPFPLLVAIIRRGIGARVEMARNDDGDDGRR